MTQKIALILIGGGLLTMLGFSIESIFADSDIPLGIRIAIAVVIAGCLILLISIGRERYRASKGKEEEDFREVKY